MLKYGQQAQHQLRAGDRHYKQGGGMQDYVQFSGTLQDTMRTSLLFLALAVANGATVAFSSVLRSTKYTSKPDIVSAYLDKLIPVAKDVLVNRIAGPAIGADVNPRSSSRLMRSTLTLF